MKRQFYSPGITYATQSTLSFGPQPVVGRGAQQLHIKEAKPVSKSSTHFSATRATTTGDSGRRRRAAARR